MDSKVKVTADAAGNVIIPSENNETWGFIRVEQTRLVIEESGIARRKKMSALVPGLIEDLKGFGWKKDDEIEGKIIAKERLTPFNTENPDKDYKIAGKTGVVCCIDAQPIYRKTFYTQNMKAHDETLEHDNGDAIKAAYAQQKEKAGAEENQESLRKL